MQRVFHEDGTVLGIPSHEPFWFQDSECRFAIPNLLALCAPVLSNAMLQFV